MIPVTGRKADASESALRPVSGYPRSMPSARRFPPPWMIDEHPELLGHPDEPEE
jgi:hypothetical protein